MQVSYTTARPGARPEQLIGRIDAGSDDGRCLILRGDVLRTPLIDEFLRHADDGEAGVVHAFTACGRYAHLSLYRGGARPALPRWARKFKCTLMRCYVWMVINPIKTNLLTCHLRELSRIYRINS